MDKDRFKILIDRFNKGELDEAGVRELEKLIAEGAVDMHALTSIQQLNEQLDQIRIPQPGKGLDQSFYSMLSEVKASQKHSFKNVLSTWINALKIEPSPLKLAYAFVLIIIGFWIGNQSHISDNKKQIDKLSGEVQQMQHMMMLTLLNEKSATQRLKAINFTDNLSHVDEKVIDALLQTLNNDENANVRLAAIDALLKYADNEKVRAGMVASIARQNLPIVQVTLADALVLLKEKSAVDGLRKLMDKEETDPAVKRKISESIDKLI